MADGEYFIYVKKQNSSFTILDDDNNESKNDTILPSAGISSDTNVIFKVGVTVLSSSDNDTFKVGDKYYKLNLETTPIGNAIINNSKSFKDAVPATAAAPAAPADVAVPPAADDNVNSNNNVVHIRSDGGQKQKQQKSKRNYSKKRRSSKSKSDTLRNYFNYDHLQ
jgi:hypothetical protein